MLVFRECKHRFRQIFFHHGHLRIARQVDLDPALDEAAINQALMDETQRAVKYVYNQKLIPLNSEVGFVYVNVAHHDEAEIRQLYQERVVQRNWQTDKLFIVGGELGELTKGLTRTNTPHSAMETLSHFIDQASPPSFYQNLYVQTVRGYWWGRKSAWALAGLLATVALFLGVQAAIDGWRLQTQSQAMSAQQTLLTQQKQALQSQLALEYDARHIQTTVEFAQAVIAQRSERGFFRIWQDVGQVLERHPHIALQRLSWEDALPISAQRFELALTGWVYPFNQSFEPPTQWVQAFARDLEALSGLQAVTIDRPPLSASPEEALNLNQSALQTQSALPFEMTLVFAIRNQEAS
jgi:hypothetical protein